MRETNAPVLRSPKREASLLRTSGVECVRKLVDGKRMKIWELKDVMLAGLDKFQLHARARGEAKFPH
jgi:hypothetical protein